MRMGAAAVVVTTELNYPTAHGSTARVMGRATDGRVRGGLITMRRETKSEREQWTAFCEGRETAKESKYHNEREGKYASKHEAQVAGDLAALARAGKILDLQEQVRIVLVPGDGKLRPIVYIADFTYLDREGKRHVLDAKGFKTAIYRLKKRMAALLLGITIEDV
jgi:hypothetical protein